MTVQDRIYNQALRDGIPDTFARLMVAWFSYETAYNGLPFNSPVFLRCNNVAGYKYVGQQTAAGACSISPEGDPYAYYRTLEDSVHEISLWIGRRMNEGIFPADLRTITNTYQLSVLLKNAQYYGDTVTRYSNGLAYWWEQVKGLQLSGKTAGIGLLLLVGAGFAYYYRKQLFKSKTVSIFD
jgi:hypothetical protein